MCVADQGEKCSEDNRPKKRGFAQKIVPGFVFDLITRNVPKRSCRSRGVICARMFECAGMVIVVRDQRLAPFARCGEKQIAAACVTGH
jgi:hypothetical protein